MSTSALEFAAIDTAIAKGEWWITLFEALSEAGMKQVDALKPAKGAGFVAVVQAYCRLAHAVRLAIVAALRLDLILQGLADLRRLAPEAIAAARARARARVEEAAAARAEARDKARAKREALLGRGREDAVDGSRRDTQDRDKLDLKTEALRDRDPAVEALERRLTVDPAGVDFDALPLRRIVERICAALGVTPDWSRWEAGDWTMSDPPRSVHRDVQRQKRPIPPEAKSHSRVAIPTLPGLEPRRTDTAIALALACHAGPHTPPWPALE